VNIAAKGVKAENVIPIDTASIASGKKSSLINYENTDDVDDYDNFIDSLMSNPKYPDASAGFDNLAVSTSSSSTSTNAPSPGIRGGIENHINFA
jgi:hypothetical protein